MYRLFKNHRDKSCDFNCAKKSGNVAKSLKYALHVETFVEPIADQSKI